VVGGELFFDAGDGLSIVGGEGGGYRAGIAGYAGGGGGGSFVFGGTGLLSLLFCGLGNHVDLRGLLGGAGGIRTSDLLRCRHPRA
jgi:hypothetical protein